MVNISGILGIIFGGVSAVVFVLYPERTFISAVPAVLSLCLLLVFFIVHYESFRAFSRRRSTQFGLNSIMMIVLFIFIIVVLNLIARLYYARTDMSSTSRYSLAPQTENVVSALRSGVRVTVFGQEGSPAFRKAEDLLEGYRYLNRNLVYSVVDLDREPLLAKQYGVNRYDSIIIEAERERVLVEGVSEETITNGIIRATREKKDRILFIAGHGERSISDTGRGGIAKAYQRLVALGYEVTQFTLSSTGGVPGDTALLVIAGPSEAFSGDDVEKVHRYMAGGGRLLGLFDPGYDTMDITGIAGMRAIDAFITDPSSNLGGKDEKIPLVTDYPDSPVTRDFKLTTVYPGVAPLATGGLPERYDYLNVVVSSPGSMVTQNGRTIPAKDDDHVIAAIAGSRQGKDIFIVFGDSDFASNAFFDVVGNGNMFLNCVNWAAGEGELVSIAPRKDDFVPLYLTPEQGRSILYVSVAGIPLCIFAAGLFVWWRRRRL